MKNAEDGSGGVGVGKLRQFYNRLPAAFDILQGIIGKDRFGGVGIGRKSPEAMQKDSRDLGTHFRAGGIHGLYELRASELGKGFEATDGIGWIGIGEVIDQCGNIGELVVRCGGRDHLRWSDRCDGQQEQKRWQHRAGHRAMVRMVRREGQTGNQKPETRNQNE